MKKLSEKSLGNVALFSLRRYSGSRKGLVQTLERKVKGQSDVGPAEAKVIVDQVVARMEAAGYVDDVRMAESKSASLQRQGKSSRAIELKLREKGIAPELAKSSALTTPERELEAACMLVKRKRLGVDPARNRRDFAVLMRAGFGSDVARQALRSVEVEEVATGKVIQLPPSPHQLEQEAAAKWEAALALVHRKNLGTDPSRKQRDLGVLVRAGFDYDIAKRALAEEALSG